MKTKQAGPGLNLAMNTVFSYFAITVGTFMQIGLKINTSFNDDLVFQVDLVPFLFQVHRRMS